MSGPWRLIDTGRLSAAENICLDQAILLARSKEKAPDTVRFLQFTPPAVLIGFHQSVEQEVRETFCWTNGIDINRRITGGGAIYFDETQLGWEVISSLEKGKRDVLGLYKRLCSAAIIGLKELGVEASFRPVNDIEVRGRKISGTGGTDVDGAYLFQGTLLVDFDVQTMLKALRIPTEKLKDKEVEALRERVTCLKWELGEVPGPRVIREALLFGFKEVFDVDLEVGELTTFEQAHLEEHLPDFKSEDWIYRIRRPLKDERQLYSVYKAPGGIIRTSVLLNDRRDIVKYTMITGDFFAYPNRTVLDLEAALKNCRVRNMAETVRAFFEKHEPELPGMTAQDFVEAIGAAIGKRDLVALGLTPKEANMVNMVNDAMDHLDETTVVLLPYCAKWIECSLRYDEDCLECGRCTVGVGYELARMKGMEPVTIINFEHLAEVLSQMEKRGVKSYIGCCCEPFYAKHRDDLERAGIAGILLDIENTTCYELDMEKEALEGTFKEETKLDVDLLRKLLGDNGIVNRSADGSVTLVDGDIKDGKGRRRCLYSKAKRGKPLKGEE